MNVFQDYEIIIIVAKRRKTQHVNMLTNLFSGNHEYIKSVFNLADTMSNWRYDFRKTVRSLNLFKMEKESNLMIDELAHGIKKTIVNEYGSLCDHVLKKQQINNDSLLSLPDILPILYGDGDENLKKHCPEIQTKDTISYHLHECVAQSVLKTQNLLNEHENDDHFKQWWNSKNVNWLGYHIVKNTMKLHLPYTFNSNDLALKIKAQIFTNLCTVDKNGTPHSVFDYVDVHIKKRKTNHEELAHNIMTVKNYLNNPNIQGNPEKLLEAFHTLKTCDNILTPLRIVVDKHKSQMFIDGVLTT